MIQNVEFNFEIWKQDMFYFGQCSYFQPDNKAIYIYYHAQKDKETAFKAVIIDVNHESIHAILNEIEGMHTSRKYDNVAVRIESYVSEMHRQVWSNWNKRRDKGK